MDLTNLIQSIFSDQLVLVVAGFLFAFIVTWLGIPSVVRIATIKCLYDLPGDRTSHEVPTPRLGGAMIFAGVILSSVLFTSLSNAYELKFIIAGMIVLFFIGVKDDVISLHPLKKAVGQLFAALIIVFAGNIRLSCSYGIFGLEELPYLASVLLTVFVIMFLINSINFIDGIDGLAAGIGIIVSSGFGLWYFLNYQLSYSVMSFALTGSLIAFFHYNVFSKKYKIFLGDTGSMLIGFLLAVQTIHFLELASETETLTGNALGPSLAIAILFVPIFDTLRICIIRILNGKSIFQGDNNHVHHRVLRFTGSHLKATLTILSINLALVALTYLLGFLGNATIIIGLVILGVIFSILLGTDIKDRNNPA